MKRITRIILAVAAVLAGCVSCQKENNIETNPLSMAAFSIIPDFTDLVTHPSPQPAFTARFDVARFAGWKSWNSEYSEKDRTVILNREGRVVRVRANGEHRTDLGSITEIDAAGNEKTDRVDAVLSDGRILLPLTCLDRF